jgi:membrane-associated protease RseP (regulator of RpoE activity)
MTRPWSRFVFPAVLGAIGLGVGAWLGASLGPEQIASPADSTESLRAGPPKGAQTAVSPAVGSASAGPDEEVGIWAALEQEVEARSRLEDEVAALRAEVAVLGRSGAEAGPDRTARAPNIEPRPDRPWFDSEGLLDAGVAPTEVQNLRERFEQIELARLYLRDRAAREGWAGSSRFREESRALDARFEGLRAELGAQGYDRLLFAIGRPNRARVHDLLERAPAREAGLKPGDVIVSYDGRRIFTVSELRRATTEGQAGAPVEVRLERNGEEIRLFVPRGPLGARLVPARSPPLR